MTDQTHVSALPVQPAPGRTLTCWRTSCPTPATWMVRFDPPVMSAQFMVLCEKHLNEFSTDMAEWPD